MNQPYEKIDRPTAKAWLAELCCWQTPETFESRVSDIMTPVAKDLSNDQISALAKYFAAQPWPNFHQAAADTDAEKAKTLADAGQCTACHGVDYVGHDRTPRVGNQKPDYLQQALTDPRGTVRQDAARMAAVVRSWSDDDIAAMSRYLAGL